jgi:hypothetical protein
LIEKQENRENEKQRYGERARKKKDRQKNFDRISGRVN